MGLLMGSFDTAGEWVYALEHTDEDRITARLQSLWSNTNLPGQDRFESTCDDDCPEFILQITLQGDTFKFGDSLGAAPDFSGPHRAHLVFFRLDCPE
jgi:hypothetical protein